MHRIKISIVVALIPVLACFAGCGRKPVYPAPADGISRFVTGEPLREGDIILARSYGLIGALFANFSMEGGMYSHGAMIYRGDDGRMLVLNYRPTGMESPSCTPEEFFSRYNRLALVRYNGDLDQAKPSPETGLDQSLRGGAALSASARRWVAKNTEKRIPPDYRLNHDEHSAMFCLELPSTVYRECGLPDPFHFAKKADKDPLLSLANRMFKVGAVEIRSPSSALSNPDFATVAEWLRPEYDLREEALNEELAKIITGELKDGYVAANPNFWGRFKIQKIFVLYHVATTVMFWMPKQDLPDFIDREVVNNAYMFYNYIMLSKKAAAAEVKRTTMPVFAIDDSEPTLRRVREIVREKAACYRDTYLRRER